MLLTSDSVKSRLDYVVLACAYIFTQTLHRVKRTGNTSDNIWNNHRIFS